MSVRVMSPSGASEAERNVDSEAPEGKNCSAADEQTRTLYQRDVCASEESKQSPRELCYSVQGSNECIRANGEDAAEYAVGTRVVMVYVEDGAGDGDEVGDKEMSQERQPDRDMMCAIMKVAGMSTKKYVVGLKEDVK